MRKYLARRLLLYFPTLFLASLGIFGVMRVLPGDVALLILGGEDSAPGAVAQLETLRRELGLDQPLYEQYGRWAWSMVNGEFGGRSVIDKEPLSSIIARRLPVTLLLTTYTVIIAWLLSVPMGMIAALYQNRWPDYILRIVTLAGAALPNFWVALVVLLALLIFFRWTPPILYANLWDNPGAHFQKMFWPTMVLAWGYSSYLGRVTRSTMLEVLRQDYIRTARSKGLAERVVMFRHGLRNALIPVITLGGLQLAALLSGTVIIETVFGVPGIGQGVVGAAANRDYPVIQSLTMLLVAIMLTLNLLIDIIYAKVDPRVSYA